MTTSSLRPPRSFADVLQLGRFLLTDPSCFIPLAALVLVGDVVLTQLIVRFVSYTEIDWETYMYQLELYMKGERDYALISGPTGPLVYPAGHVYIHRLLYALTDSGTDIAVAQQIYAALYTVSLALTLCIYHQAGSIPNWVLFVLPLSKRLHSIFVLRLFNDCWAVVAAQAAILTLGHGWDTVGTILLSVAVSIKMSALLYLPALIVIVFKRRGFLSTITHTLLFIASQLLIGLPFLLYAPRSYLHYAYEFSREFMYKWTVNWRFIDEKTFSGEAWPIVLLSNHIMMLVAFGLYRWCRRDGGVWTVVFKGLRHPRVAPPTAPITADYVTTILFTSNLLGILFARSLHYQFYSWYAYQLPFLAWRTRYPVIIKLALLGCIEYAWNVFPSTPISSFVLYMANTALLVGIWAGYPEGKSTDASKQE